MTVGTYIRYCALLLLIGVLQSHGTIAADIFEYGPFKLQRYTENDGLVSAEVNGTYKDVHGFLWISTFNGLSRFDGRKFENYNRQSGLTESNVDIIGNDAVGNLFIKSVSAIYRFTGRKPTPFLKYPASGGFITTACAYGNGQVWVAYEGKPGIELISAEGRKDFITTSTPVLQLVRVSDTEIYVLESNGTLWLLHHKKRQFIRTIQPQHPYQNGGVRLYQDPAGGVWSYGANARCVYQHKGVQIIDSVALPPKTPWWQWFVGAKGNLYLASDSGSVFQLISHRWQQILTKEQVQGPMYQITEDEKGTIWLSSLGGLLRITRKRYQQVPAAAPAHYFTTDGNGRYILRRDSLLYTLPNAITAFKTLAAQTITHVYVTRNRQVWYSTEEGVYHLPYKQPLQKLPTGATYEGNKAVFRFRRELEDGRGGLWISSYHGIFYKRGDSIQYFFDREGLTEGAIYTTAIDRNGIFYAAGVHVYAFQGSRFQNISKQLGLPDEISRLSTDAYGNLWINQEGTNKLIKVDYTNSRFQVADSLLLEMNGIPVVAASATFDSQNNLWTTDNRTLYCYRYLGGRYQKPLYLWPEAFSGSPLLFADDEGIVQALSSPVAGNYLRSYSTRALLQQYQVTKPQIQLTGIHWPGDTAMLHGSVALNTLGISQGLNLTHNQNLIHFYFSGTTPDVAPGVVYRYRLAGLSKAWSAITDVGEARYTALPAGDYTFEVQARSAGGDWSRSFQYRFRIQPVWYLTTAAKVVWSLLVAGLIASFVYYRGLALKRKARVQRLIVEEQLKALRAQINPHFLQNTFAFLAHEFYLSQNTKAVKAIDGLSTYLKNVLKYSDKSVITLEEELEFAEEYLRMQQQLLSTPFDYRIDVADEIDVFDVQVPSMLLQPVLENALKYGLDPQRPNKIFIALTTGDHFIRCSVNDTGNHTHVQKAPIISTGKGLALTIDRMKLFYQHKRNKPQLTRRKNNLGGCETLILIPLT